MIVHDLNIARARGSVWPGEADTPLLIDANGVLPCPIAPEGFQPVAGQVSEIGEGRGRIQNREPTFGLSLEALKGANELASREAFRLFVPKPQNHLLTSMAAIPMYVKRTFPLAG
jgi:hypothetical protein